MSEKRKLWNPPKNRRILLNKNIGFGNLTAQKVAWTTPERRINWQRRGHRSHGLHRLPAIVHDHLEVSYESGEVGKLTFEKVFLQK